MLFNQQMLADITEITLKNRLGSFVIKKNIAPNSTWNLTSPRSLKAQVKTVEKILYSLKQIKIRKIFPKDPIYILNFTLNSPQIEITLKNKGGTQQKLQLGLVNPIDNSTYGMLSNTEAIYHLDAMKYPLTTLDLSDFIDSRVFSFKPQNIASLKLYKGKKKNNNVQLYIAEQKNKWVNGINKRPLNHSLVQQHIEKLTSFKGQIILDKMTKPLIEAIDKFKQAPLYTLEVKKDGQQTLLTYLISPIISSLPDVKMEKRQNFIIQASDSKHPFILHKETLFFFRKKISSFRGIQKGIRI